MLKLGLYIVSIVVVISTLVYIWPLGETTYYQYTCDSSCIPEFIMNKVKDDYVDCEEMILERSIGKCYMISQRCEPDGKHGKVYYKIRTYSMVEGNVIESVIIGIIVIFFGLCVLAFLGILLGSVCPGI